MSADMTLDPTLLIATRFGIGVTDRAWLDHRLDLFSAITVPSLSAQSNQNFFWAVCVDANLPDDIRHALEVRLRPFGGRAFLFAVTDGTYKPPMPALIGKLDLAESSHQLLTGIIDDDDAWSVDVVDTVLERAQEWQRSGASSEGVGITFENGIEWIMYDMVDLDLLQQRGDRFERQATVRPYRYSFHSMSVFVLSTVASGITALSAAHSHMNKFLKQNYFDVDCVSTDQPMWLYCRHKQAESAIQKSKAPSVAMSIGELASRFGLNEKLTRQYIERADSYGYSVIKRVSRFRVQLARELKEVRLQKEDARNRGHDAGDLALRERQLIAELQTLSESVVHRLDDSGAAQAPIFRKPERE